MTMAQVTWLDTGCAGSYQGLEPQTLCPVKPDFLWLLALEAPMTPGPGSSGSPPCLLSPSPVPGPATLAAQPPLPVSLPLFASFPPRPVASARAPRSLLSLLASSAVCDRAGHRHCHPKPSPVGCLALPVANYAPCSMPCLALKRWLGRHEVNGSLLGRWQVKTE